MASCVDHYLAMRNIASLISDKELPCIPNLGLKDFKSLSLKSEGVSGDVLAAADLQIEELRLPVVIKFFRIPCSYKTFSRGNRTIVRRVKVEDKNQYEIGTSLLLTTEILLNPRHLTPHITFCFIGGECHTAYQTVKSMCNSKAVIEDNNYLVPQDCDDKLNIYPQCRFRTDYNRGNLSDRINYLLVEHLDGDLEVWIKDELSQIKEYKLSIEEFNYKIIAILIMIAYTLYVLDNYLDGFVHGDLGPRNVLYLRTNDYNNIWRYNLAFDNGANYQYNLRSVGISPKLWDFSTTYTGLIDHDYYNYIPNPEQREPSKVKQDVTILFNKIKNIIEEEKIPVPDIINYVLNNSHDDMTNTEICTMLLTHPFILDNFTEMLDGDIVCQYFSYP